MALENRVFEFTHEEVLQAIEAATKIPESTGAKTLMQAIVTPARNYLFDPQSADDIQAVMDKYRYSVIQHAQKILVNSVLGPNVRYALGEMSGVGDVTRDTTGRIASDKRGWQISAIVKHECKIL